MTKLYCNVSFIVPGLLVLLGSCNRESSPAVETRVAEVLPEDIVELREDQVILANIELGVLEMQSLGSILKVNGIISVAPQNMATVCMPIGGFIKNTSLLPGNAVSKGQVLAVIDNQEFVDVQQVTVEYKNLKALVKSLEQKLILIGIDPVQLREDNISSTVNLVSPISGYLKAVNINIGKYVNPTEVLFEIVNNDKLFLELTLFEKDADKVAAGQKVKFYINNETEDHEAVITQTGKSVGENKTFMVYATVSSTCTHLLSGMYVNAYVSESDIKVTSLPSDAVVSFDDKNYIFTFEKDKDEAGKSFTEYRMIEVRKGVSGFGFTEIKLPEGFNTKTAKVVTKGAYSLLSAKKNAGEMAC